MTEIWHCSLRHWGGPEAVLLPGVEGVGPRNGIPDGHLPDSSRWLPEISGVFADSGIATMLHAHAVRVSMCRNVAFPHVK